MSPEVITHHEHSFECDYFAIGVIVHELMLGMRPYSGKGRQEIREQMLSRQVKIEVIPSEWSSNAIDFVNRLLERKVNRRLGSRGGCSEIQNHSWLKGFDWAGLRNFELEAPYIPLVPFKFI